MSQKLFGWIVPEERTRQQTEYHEIVMATTPQFQDVLIGDYREDKGQFFLWEFSKRNNGGRHIRYVNQTTGSCFQAGTPIKMADGTKRPIEDILVGDEVISHTGTIRKVVRVFNRKYNGELYSFHLLGAKAFTVTGDHNMLSYTGKSGDNWKLSGSLNTVKAESVSVGDRFVTANGVGVPVEKIVVDFVEDYPVYCCEVEVDHSLVVNEICLRQCVGAGGFNMLLTLGHVEIANGDAEHWPKDLAWWPYTYGQSRLRAGLRGRGDGSFGSAWADAIVKDGIFSREEAAADGKPVPDFQYLDSWIRLSQSVEYEWSDGAAKSAFLPLGRKHPVKSAARIRSAEEAKAALKNGYPITIACMFGTRTIRATGSPAVQLAEWDDRWAHQQSVIGCWDHPTLGLIFYVLNQWGSQVHPQPLNGEPPGGYWIRASTFNMMLQSEGFAFSGFDGFKVRELSWYI